MKFFSCIFIVILALVFSSSARRINRQQAADGSFGRSHNQARVYSGEVAIKKLVLLKFKKVLPTSLILLRSNTENEAELVPVYPTDEIPKDAQFIPTPNGISGHKDVQAIAVPNEFLQELEQHGFTNLEGVESPLNQAEEIESGESSLAVAEADGKENELLQLNDEHGSQLLESSKKSGSSVGRLPAERVKSALKAQTSIEEIPIYLYSTNDNTHVAKHQIGASGRYRQRP